jgi:hypothetical protein
MICFLWFNWFFACLIDWLLDWLIVWLIYRLIDWLLCGWLIDELIDCWLIDWLFGWLLAPVIDRVMPDWLNDWYISRLIEWLIDWWTPLRSDDQVTLCDHSDAYIFSQNQLLYTGKVSIGNGGFSNFISITAATGIGLSILGCATIYSMERLHV